MRDNQSHGQHTTLHDLVGMTISSITGMEPGSEEILIHTEEGVTFRMWHWQDCCESVQVEEVHGDASDLIGKKVLLAEERTNKDDSGKFESGTWTFYEIRTLHASVTIRWLGQSNGYYGEGVDVEKIIEGERVADLKQLKQI